MGVVSQADALNVLARKGASTPAASSATTAVQAVLAGSSKTDEPPTDQGFGSRPVTLGMDPVTGSNPMATYQGGSVGGLLGAAAQSGAKTLSDFNKTGMIAADFWGNTNRNCHEMTHGHLEESAQIGNLADIKMPPRRRLRKNTLYQLLTSFPEPWHFYE